jgi:hypothetical protein
MGSLIRERELLRDWLKQRDALLQNLKELFNKQLHQALLLAVDAELNPYFVFEV